MSSHHFLDNYGIQLCTDNRRYGHKETSINPHSKLVSQTAKKNVHAALVRIALEIFSKQSQHAHASENPGYI